MRERHRREMTIYYNTFYDVKSNEENEIDQYCKTKGKMIDRHSAENVDKNNMSFNQTRRIGSERL
jgi:cytosine/adenosine deaminase-related metal-dependent hydrolase